METIKYEAVFGDQSLFDNAPLGTELVGHSGGFYKNSPDGPIYCGGCTFTTDEYRNIGFIAARRVIRTPTWTVEDHKAGRLPEVGCKAIGLYDQVVTVTSVDIRNGLLTVQDENDQCISIYRFSDLKPIETPEELAQRLEDEWVIQQLNINTLPILTEKQWRQIYRAMLSCELQSPKDSK